jgi:hypothetical protein
MNILSLFDGISCGQIALNRAKIEYDNYYASEIDTDAIKITMKNYPKTIQLGDITDLHLDSDSNSDNIFLEIEDLTAEPIKTEDSNVLKEVDLSSSLENNLESITLKKPNQVYYEIYKKAREKAKEAKKEAILAFLEAKNIKKTYMLDDIDESEDDEEEDLNFDEIEEIE